MGGLKFFNKDTYESLGEAFKAIKQELLSLCPKDSSSVRWQRGMDGMSATVKAGQSAAEEGGDAPEEFTSQPSGYNGYFTIKDVSTYNEDGTVKEYRVAVCDGETWDATTEKSGDSIAYCMGNDIHFQSIILTLTESADIYLKCGPVYSYFNRIVFQKKGTEKPSRLGYEYIIIGTANIQNGMLSITQRLTGSNNGGVIYVPYAQYSGDFALRLLENEEDDTVVEGKVAVCNGMSWNAKDRTSLESYATINSIEAVSQMPGSPIVVDFSLSHKIYLKAVMSRRQYIDVISTTERTPPIPEDELTYGYTLIAMSGEQIPPAGGLYNILLFAKSCATKYPLIDDPDGSEQ